MALSLASSLLRFRTGALGLLRGVKTFLAKLPLVDRTRTNLPILISRWTWWILPTLVFGAIVLSVLVIRVGGPDLAFVLLGATLVLGLSWIIISALHPARADRTCPECKEEALERLDPGTTRGVVCSRCGYTDPDTSSWYLAEEETTLEEIVMAERGRVSGLEPEELARVSSADAAPNTEITE